MSRKPAPPTGIRKPPPSFELADRLDDIAGQLDIAMLAVEGARAIGGTQGLSDVARFIGEIRREVKAVSDDIHPNSPDDAVTGDNTTSDEVMA